jgi:hypothetical protein
MSKNGYFWGKLFGENILKIATMAPGLFLFFPGTRFKLFQSRQGYGWRIELTLNPFQHPPVLHT